MNASKRALSAQSHSEQQGKEMAATVISLQEELRYTSGVRSQYDSIFFTGLHRVVCAGPEAGLAGGLRRPAGRDGKSVPRGAG